MSAPDAVRGVGIGRERSAAGRACYAKTYLVAIPVRSYRLEGT